MNGTARHRDSRSSKVRYAWPAQMIAGLVLHFMSVCWATGETMFKHSFEFDTPVDSPDAEVLDYQYGSRRQFGTHADKEKVQLGRTFHQWGISGVMPRGEFLYVKWRLKSSGQVYEDKVNLTTRLPADITDHRIHFVIKGSQLYVYLISPEKRAASSPPGPLRMYSDLKQYQIYPDPTK
jgi:hypothetical protein